MISCKGYNVNLETAVVAILVFCRMSHINSIQGLSGIKAISKCEVNPTSGFQDIAFTSNCEQMDGQTDGRTDGQPDRRTEQGHSIIDGRIKKRL